MIHMWDVRKRSAISILKMLSASVQFAVARVTSLMLLIMGSRTWVAQFTADHNKIIKKTNNFYI
jgi:hypothetical protein